MHKFYNLKKYSRQFGKAAKDYIVGGAGNYSVYFEDGTQVTVDSDGTQTWT